MEATIWLQIGASKKYGRWVAGHVQAFKKKPDTRDDQVAIKLTLDIPDEVWEEPVYEAKITMPKVTKNFPESIDVAKHVGAELSKKMGFRVKVEIPDDATTMPGSN